MHRGEVTCMMCGTVVGEIRADRFIHHPACERPVRWQGKLPRCCRCGGSLYFDPTLTNARFSGVLELARAASWEL